MSNNDHSRLINAAAKAALRPLGCIQKGRSRTWLDDQSWWLGVVEFQPSSWSKGSYLNVGACWLWYEKEYLTFDDGYRVESFRPFKNHEQFANAAEALAQRASEELTSLRGRFSSPARAYAWLAAKPARSIWDHYHLAVSAGLAGEAELSRQAFADMMSHPDDRPWAEEARRRSAELARCLELGSGFESEVFATVGRTRELLRLPARAVA